MTTDCVGSNNGCKLGQSYWRESKKKAEKAIVENFYFFSSEVLWPLTSR